MTKRARYKMLEAAFKKNLEAEWRETPPVESDFRKLFDEMAPTLAKIKFNECFVDISVRRQWLDFKLFCPDELKITACRVVDHEDDSVMYSVSHHNTTLMIDHNHTLDSLVEAANKAIKLVTEEKVT